MADTYGDLLDPSNPFNVSGISDEDRAMILYLRAAKAATRLDVVVTCTTDHPSGPTRHLQPGTNGLGLAIDCRRRSRGLDIHQVVFDLWKPIETQLYELIYAGASYNIKAGRRVAPYAEADHHDHCHVAVDRGVFVVWPAPAPAPPVPAHTDYPEDAMVRHDLTSRLDDQGNGYVDVPIDPAAIVSLVPNGDDPSGPAGDVGYKPIPRFSRLAWAAGTRIVVMGGPPRGAVDFAVWTAA